MQPYFFPYIGYFQLMNAVDEFVIYDNIEFTKKGWINRNRILVGGKDSYITLPLKKDSDYLDIRDRYLAESWPSERRKMLNRILESYRKSPNFSTIFPVIESAILFEDTNLFKFILNSLNIIREFLEIKTSFVVSSSIRIDHGLKSSEKVIAICKAMNASEYINPVGGFALYDREIFRRQKIEVRFLKANEFSYGQYKNEFVPWLSIIDVMMFNTKEELKKIFNDGFTFI